MKAAIEQIMQQLRQSFWDPRSLKDKPLWLRLVIPVARTVYAIWRDWWSGELTLRAMSLVYTTLLSLVPLLAVSFSVLKAFGVHNQIDTLLTQALQPLGDQGVVITQKIVSFVDNMQVGVLGALGLGMLFYTVVALMQKIEAAFNYTWHVSQNRSIGQRFSYYLSTIMIGPVLIFSAIALSASFMDSSTMQHFLSIEPLGSLIALLAKFIPTLMIIGAFTFLYVLIPNTDVKIGSALVGATIAGLMWQGAGFLFASLVVGSAKYTAIYSALATLIFFMVWLYVGWMIVLIGASIAHYHQNPERLFIKARNMQLSFRQQRLLSWIILSEIQRQFIKGKPGPTLALLADKLSLPVESVDTVMSKLKSLGLVLYIEENDGWKPAQDLSKINLAEILIKLEKWGEHKHLSITHWQVPEIISGWEDVLEEAQIDSLKEITIDQAIQDEST